MDEIKILDYYLPETYIFPNSKCPICNSYYEDVGYEEVKAGWIFIKCSNCNYVFEVI